VKGVREWGRGMAGEGDREDGGRLWDAQGVHRDWEDGGGTWISRGDWEDGGGNWDAQGLPKGMGGGRRELGVQGMNLGRLWRSRG
jgi:hypothetical protein